MLDCTFLKETPYVCINWERVKRLHHSVLLRTLFIYFILWLFLFQHSMTSCLFTFPHLRMNHSIKFILWRCDLNNVWLCFINILFSIAVRKLAIFCLLPSLRKLWGLYLSPRISNPLRVSVNVRRAAGRTICTRVRCAWCNNRCALSNKLFCWQTNTQCEQNRQFCNEQSIYYGSNSCMLCLYYSPCSVFKQYVVFNFCVMYKILLCSVKKELWNLIELLNCYVNIAGSIVYCFIKQYWLFILVGQIY